MGVAVGNREVLHGMPVVGSKRFERLSGRKPLLRNFRVRQHRLEAQTREQLSPIAAMDQVQAVNPMELRTVSHLQLAGEESRTWMLQSLLERKLL